QLAPLLQTNADVVFALEAGFIGAWGEWHSSTHALDDDLAAKRRIHDALLDAVPPHRMVALRFPTAIDRLVGDLPPSMAFSTAPSARTGSHQDCFLGREHDFGTWGRADRSIDEDKRRMGERGRFVIVGGETCARSPRATCEVATDELEDLHFTYLNQDFHPGVIARFRRDGCYGEISRRLGYRLLLREAAYAVRGDRLRVAFTLRNAGYAAPVNPRTAFVVLERGEARVEFPLP